MTTTSGWHDDPLGRHAKRWHDGEGWTANVLNDDGSPGFDTLTSVPGSNPIEPTAPSTPLPPPPGAPTVTTPANPPAASSHSSPLPAVIAAAGLLLVALSMLVLDWVRGATFLDIAADAGATSDSPLLDQLAAWHFEWLGYVLAAATIVTAALALFASGSSMRVRHLLAAAVAGIAAVWSTLAATRIVIGAGIDLEIGAWLMPAGYLLVLVALVISARRDPA